MHVMSAIERAKAIAQRMNGQCRVNLPGRYAVALDGSRLKSFSDCSACADLCLGIHATGIAVAGGISFTLKATGQGMADIEWDCPQCSRPTHEESLLLAVETTMAVIAADPHCWKCRSLARKADHRSRT